MHRVLVILAPGFEEIEAITSIDVLRRAKIDTTTASLEENTNVIGSHGISIAADRPLSHAKNEAWTCLVLPGGLRGVENMLASSDVHDLIAQMVAKDKIVAAVCAAPLLLDAQNLLKDQSFTCHPCVQSRLTCGAPLHAPTATSQNFITGRSAGCAMVWALELVKKLLGECPNDLLAGLQLP